MTSDSSRKEEKKAQNGNFFNIYKDIVEEEHDLNSCQELRKTEIESLHS